MLDRIAERHRVVAIDRPGFGYSDRPHGTLWTPAAQAEPAPPVPLPGSGSTARWWSVIPGARWWRWRWRSTTRRRCGGLVLLSGYYKPTVRVDVPLVAPPAVPVLGDVLRHTVSPLLGAALLPPNLKAMFAPLPVPDRFRREFPYGFPVRPGQIRAEAQDAVTMVPAVAAMRTATTTCSACR